MRRNGTSATRWLLALPLAFLVIAAAALIAYKVRIAVMVGPGWDTYAFLANAAEFAGKGYGYTELHRPPLLSLLTALAFRAGAPMDVSVIQWVDGAMSLSGIVAAYLLARRRMPWFFALIAALGLLAVQPLWNYLGSGYSDFPSIAVSLWMLLACVKATEEDPRFYVVAAILFVVAVMTRYTALLAVFPTCVWIAFRWQPYRQAKALGVAVLAAVAAYLPAGVYYAVRFNEAIFPFILALSGSESVSAPGGEGSQTATALWYLSSLARFLAPESLWIMTSLALVGAAMGLGLATRAHVRRLRLRAPGLGLAVLGVAIAVFAQVMGAGLAVRQITIPVAVFALWRYLSSRDERGFSVPSSALDATMVTWWLTYLDFHGHQTIQVPRYFVTMAVPLLYFIALGWHQLGVEARRQMLMDGLESTQGIAGRANRAAAAIVLGMTIAVLLVTTGAGLAVTSRSTPMKPDRYVAAARESGVWLRDHGVEPGAVVYSDLWPLTAWYARLPVRAMPVFKKAEAYQHELSKTSADYYLTIRGRRFSGFTEATHFDSVVVLERSSETTASLPNVLYLGKAWDNYLESVTNFGFNLNSNAGRFGWEGTGFFDALSPEQLASQKVVAVYGLKWRSRAAGETALRRYVEQGGTVVIDASANLGELPYDLMNTVLFDTVIRRRSVPKDAQITVAPSFVEAHPELAEVHTTPFLDESGGRWYGADYDPLPGTPTGTVLATVNNRPLVVLKRFGKGRVYFIAYNLVWHSFIRESDDEASLIRAVFEDALSTPFRSPTPGVAR